jgi:hypothetical protein
VTAVERKDHHRDTETQRGLGLPANPPVLILSLSKDAATRPLFDGFPLVPLRRAAVSRGPILRQAQDEERVERRERLSLCLCVSVVIFSFIQSMHSGARAYP